jgi:hypothetical protein
MTGLGVLPVGLCQNESNCLSCFFCVVLLRFRLDQHSSCVVFSLFRMNELKCDYLNCSMDYSDFLSGLLD